MKPDEVLKVWNGPTSVCNKAKILQFAADMESRIRAESAQEPVGVVIEDNSKMLICGYYDGTVIPWTPKPPSLATLWFKSVEAGTKLYAAPVAKVEQDRLARYGIHSEGQPLTPYGVQLIDDLAGLVRRLRYHLKKHDPGNQLVAQADEYLRRYDLQGNPLRDDEEPAAQDCVSVPREPTAEQVSNGELAMLEVMYPDETNFASSEKGRACAERCYRAMLAASKEKT